jgi:Flp pilus assembly protein TadG
MDKAKGPRFDKHRAFSSVRPEHRGIHRESVRRRGGARRANAIIETSVVLPVLLFVVLGMVEFGQYFYIRNSFQAAARDVARAACLATAVQSDPVTRATATLAQANVTFNSSWMTIVDVSNSNSTVTDCSAVPVGDKLLVTIQCQYNLIPNAYRPLYAMTGKGIGNGKMCIGVSERIKE